MKPISNYNGMDIIAISIDQKPSKICFKLIDSENCIHELSFWNKDGSPVAVDISWLSIGMVNDPDNGRVTFGEFEDASSNGDVYFIDSDCGSFKISASIFHAQKI